MIFRSEACLVTIVALTVGMGAGCPQMLAPYTQQAPRLLSPGASLQEVMQVVNNNSAIIHSLMAPNASVRVASMPALKSQIAFQRPRRFRLVASFMGPVVDLGSNDELFWFWNRSEEPSVVLFARHSEYANSPARNVFPIEPDWLSEAFGVIDFDPMDEHLGPYQDTPGRLRIVTRRRGVAGNVQRVVVVDDATGWVLEQHLYRGEQLIASSRSSGHRLDPITGAVLPRYVDVEWTAPGAGPVKLHIDLGQVLINNPATDMPQRWAMPRGIEGSKYIDLARTGQYANRQGVSSKSIQPLSPGR